MSPPEAPAATGAGRRERFAWLAVAAAFLALPWISIGDHALYGPDEGRYAVTATNMLSTGDLLVPELGGRPRLQKPPLVYWLQAQSIHLVGKSELAARIPSALATTLAALVVLWFGKRAGGRARGLMAMCLWLAMPVVLLVGRLAIVDPLLVLFWALAVAAGHEAATSNRKAPYLLVFWGASALAVFAKGPVGLLPSASLLAWLAFSGRLRQIPSLWPLAGLAVSLTPLALWSAMVLREEPEAAMVWWREIVDRAWGTGDHPESLLFFVPVLMVGCLPGVLLLLPSSLAGGWRGVVARLRAPSLGAHMVFQLLVPFLVFSLIRGKLLHYMAPLGLPVAMLAAVRLESWLAGPESRRFWIGLLGALLSAGWIVVMVAVPTPLLQAVAKVFPELRPEILILFAPLAAAPIACWAAIAMLGGHARASTVAKRRAALLVLTAGLLVSYFWAAHCEDAFARIGSNAELAERVHAELGAPPYRVTTIGFADETLAFYLHSRVVRNDAPWRIHRDDTERTPWVIVTRPHEWERVQSTDPGFAGRFELLFEIPSTRRTTLVLSERPQ